MDLSVVHRVGRCRCGWPPARTGTTRNYCRCLEDIDAQARDGKGIAVVILEKSDQVARRQVKGSAGDRLPVLDPQVQAGRNVVDRMLSYLKGWRAIATRYDEHARNYRAGVVIASMVLFWPRRPSDTLL